MLSTHEGTMVVYEICGGEARVSKLAIRRKLKVGENFDMICGIDLSDDKTQHQVRTYTLQYAPLVVVMAPTCIPYGRRAGHLFSQEL